MPERSQLSIPVRAAEGCARSGDDLPDCSGAASRVCDDVWCGAEGETGVGWRITT